MRVFISYRGIEPDIGLARAFYAALKAAGHRPWMARETLSWGERWGTEIDDELDKCECYFLLLSDAAAKSDAVIGELARAHRRRDRESPPSPRIIVLRVRLTIEPAYDIGYRIEPFQQREWNSDADTETRTSELLRLLADPETTAQQGPKSLTKSALLPPPSPSAGLPGGRLPVHSDLYQTRSGLDSDALRYALSPPSILRLRGPRQVGKSSLMARLLEEAKAKGHRIASLSIQLAGHSVMRTTDRLIEWFCVSLEDELGCEGEFSKVSKAGGPLSTCKRFLKRAVLTPGSGSLVIAIDEIDALLSVSSTAEDFYGMIRAFKDLDDLRDITFLLSYSTEGALAKGRGQSPLENVGIPYTLRDFDAPEFNRLAASYLNHGQGIAADEIFQIFSETAGHPYLSSLGLHSMIVQRQSLHSALSWEQPGLLAEHLTRLMRLVSQDSSLGSNLGAVCRSTDPVSIPNEIKYKLEGMGLVKSTADGVVPRCSLYRRFFLTQPGS